MDSDAQKGRGGERLGDALFLLVPQDGIDPQVAEVFVRSVLGDLVRPP